MCRAFSGALKIVKLKAPLIPSPEGAVDTNDWCIKLLELESSHDRQMSVTLVCTVFLKTKDL